MFVGPNRRLGPVNRSLLALLLTMTASAVSLGTALPGVGRGSVAHAAPAPTGPPAADDASSRVTFEVLPVAPTVTPTPAPTPSGGGHLPVTGPDAMPPAWLIGLGLLLLIVGAVIALGARRVGRHRA